MENPRIQRLEKDASHLHLHIALLALPFIHIYQFRRGTHGGTPRKVPASQQQETAGAQSYPRSFECRAS